MNDLLSKPLEPEPKLLVKISNYEQRNTIIYYIIEIVENDINKWTIAKRYSEFQILDHLLRPMFYPLPLLPSKVMWPWNQNAQIEKRRLKLELYLQALADRPGISSNNCFRLFLKFHLKGANDEVNKDPKLKHEDNEAMTPISVSLGSSAQMNDIQDLKTPLNYKDILAPSNSRNEGNVVMKTVQDFMKTDPAADKTVRHVILKFLTEKSLNGEDISLKLGKELNQIQDRIQNDLIQKGLKELAEMFWDYFYKEDVTMLMNCENLQAVYKLIFAKLSHFISGFSKEFNFFVKCEKTFNKGEKEPSYFTILNANHKEEQKEQKEQKEKPSPILIAHFSEKFGSNRLSSFQNLVRALVSTSLAFGKKPLWGLIADNFSQFIIQFDSSNNTATLSRILVTSFNDLSPEEVSKSWIRLAKLLIALILNSLNIDI